MSAGRLAKAAIKIPMRIERGPTDILRALASTIKHIPSEPDVSLSDDPYLLPRRPNDQVVFTLSKLSGKRTARYILDKHPECFTRDDAEPKVAMFLPPEQFNPEMEFAAGDIKWCIENHDPVNGLIAYKALEAKGIKLDDELMMQFFEMLCYTNEERQLDILDHGVAHYFADSTKQLVDETWKTNGTASKVFDQIKDDLDPERVYSAMISGLTRFSEHAKAKQAFDDFKQAHPSKALTRSAYSGLIRSAYVLNSSLATATEAVNEILSHMEECLVLPDLKIFNSILIGFRYFNVDEEVCTRSFQLINDMKALEIEPSLATYEALIKVVSKFKGGRAFEEIALAAIDSAIAIDPTKPIVDDRDLDALAQMMNSLNNKPDNLRLAKKVHKIYMKRPTLFRHELQKNGFMNAYFNILITADKPQNMIDFFDNYVPAHCRPRIDNLDAFVDALELYQVDEETVERIGLALIEMNCTKKLKNDDIFKRHPKYVEGLRQAEESDKRRAQFNKNRK